MPTEIINLTEPDQSGKVQLNYIEPQKPTSPKSTPVEPKEPDKKPEKQDDLEKSIDDILAGLGYKQPKLVKETEKIVEKPDEKNKSAPDDDKKVSQTAADQKTDEESGKPDQIGADKPKTPDKKASKPAKKTESYDAATIQALARDAATQVINQSKLPDEPNPVIAPTPIELDDKEIRNLAILQRMETDNPGKYKGLADKTLKGTVAFKQYRAKWEQDNPDEDFDPDSEQHQKMISKLLPAYDQEDFDDTRITLRSEEILARRDKERDKQDAEKEVQGRLAQIISHSEAEFVKGADDGLYQLYIQPDGIKKMSEADKLATRALSQVRQKLVGGVTELEKLTDPKMEYKANPSNPIHIELGKFALDTERAIKQLPLENQLDVEGKRFVTKREFDAMSPAQREHVWILTKDHLLTIWTKRCAEEAKGMIQDLREAAKDYAKSQGYEPKASASDSAQNKPAANEPKPIAATDKPNPPNTASSSDTIKTTDQSLNQPPDLVQTIVKGLFG